MINWCSDCKHPLSDAEVEHEEKQGHLWHIRYPVKDSDEFVEIATTRPETMLAIPLYLFILRIGGMPIFVGEDIDPSIVNREIPIITDSYVDREFGTGAVKITPAHDPNDFEVGLGIICLK